MNGGKSGSVKIKEEKREIFLPVFTGASVIFQRQEIPFFEDGKNLIVMTEEISPLIPSGHWWH
jgi:hypothetical protein